MGSPPLSRRARGRSLRSGVTLLESVLAAMVLSIGGLGIIITATASMSNLKYAQSRSCGLRLAEHLMDEIIAAPPEGSGPQRSQWGIKDYDGLSEEPGGLVDAIGHPCMPEQQVFRRRVAINSALIELPGLAAAPLNANEIVITVTSPGGEEWRLRRLVPDPVVP